MQKNLSEIAVDILLKTGEYISAKAVSTEEYSAKILNEKDRYGDAVSRAYSMHYAVRVLLSTKKIFPKR